MWKIDGCIFFSLEQLILITCDKDANAFYIKFSDGKAAKTFVLENDKFVDVDERGKIVGFEVLNSIKNETDELTKVIVRTKSIEISA